MVPSNNAYFANFRTSRNPVTKFVQLARIIYIICFVFIAVLRVNAQDKERFFQVTGLITDEDNRALSNVGVVSMKLKRGTLSERSGIYSITSTPGDTILYKALGFKKKFVIVPQVFEGRILNKDIVMTMDTIPIENVVVLPWKSYSDFIKEMTTPAPLPVEIENMNENLSNIKSAASNQTGVSITPEAGYRYAMQQNFNNLATRNQSPVNNLLNPFAWAKFINGIKSGLFKNQREEKPARVKERTKTRKKKNR